MFCLTPRRVRRALIPLIYLVFSAGMTVSSAAFYHNKPLDPEVKVATISDLMSPADNPHGYAVAIAALLATGILLVPAVLLFYRKVRKNSPKLALAGAGMFAFGLAAMISIGVLSPFVRDDTPLHFRLAHIAFVGICAGIACHLVAARATLSLVLAQCGVLAVLGYLYFGSEFFWNHSLLTSFAFLECILCLDFGVGLWGLAKHIELACAKE